MKFRKQALFSARDIQLLILIGIITVAVSGTLIGADIQVSRRLPGGGGFFAPWEAAREFLYRHASPYGSAVTSSVQQQVYGRPAQPGENPYVPAIPFFLLLGYLPIAGLSDPLPQQGWLAILNAFSDPTTARGIGLFIGEAALVATALFSLQLIEWQPPRLFQIAYALISVFCFYSVVALLEGGPAIILGCVYMAILVAYTRDQDELAGALLVFTLMAWEIGVFFVVLLLWKSVYDKRGRVLAGFGMTLTVLLIISFIAYPAWPLAYSRAVLELLRSSFGMTAGAVFARLWPAYGTRAAQAVSILLVLLLLYEWAATRHADARRFIWTACLTLAITPLVGLRTELSSLVVLFPCLALILAAMSNRRRAGYVLASLLLLIVLLLPWAWFLRGSWLNDPYARDYLFLFLPVFSVAGLYWTRWWFVRPPRTWFDHVRGSLSATRPLANSRRSLITRN